MQQCDLGHYVTDCGIEMQTMYRTSPLRRAIHSDGQYIDPNVPLDQCSYCRASRLCLHSHCRNVQQILHHRHSVANTTAAATAPTHPTAQTSPSILSPKVRRLNQPLLPHQLTTITVPPAPDPFTSKRASCHRSCLTTHEPPVVPSGEKRKARELSFSPLMRQGEGAEAKRLARRAERHVGSR